MAMNALNDRAILNLKPEAKEKKYFDGGGLYIAVKPNGKKMWRMSDHADRLKSLLTLNFQLFNKKTNSRVAYAG